MRKLDLLDLIKYGGRRGAAGGRVLGVVDGGRFCSAGVELRVPGETNVEDLPLEVSN